MTRAPTPKTDSLCTTSRDLFSLACAAAAMNLLCTAAAAGGSATAPLDAFPTLAESLTRRLAQPQTHRRKGTIWQQQQQQQQQPAQERPEHSPQQPVTAAAAQSSGWEDAEVRAVLLAAWPGLLDHVPAACLPEGSSAAAQSAAPLGAGEDEEAGAGTDAGGQGAKAGNANGGGPASRRQAQPAGNGRTARSGRCKFGRETALGIAGAALGWLRKGQKFLGEQLCCLLLPGAYAAAKPLAYLATHVMSRERLLYTNTACRTILFAGCTRFPYSTPCLSRHMQ